MEQLTQNPLVEKKQKLLDQVRHVLRTKHYSITTEEAYVLRLSNDNIPMPGKN